MQRILNLLLSASLLISTHLFAETEAPAPEAVDQINTENIQHPYPEFSAVYKATWRGGWIPISVVAEKSLSYKEDQTAELRFEADSAIAGLQEISTFSWDKEQIKPLQYRYLRTGLFDEPDRHQIFDWQNQSVSDIALKKDYPNQWHEQIQDNLSYHLQAGIDLKNGKTQFSYPVFDRKKVKDFKFQLVGYESLETKMGTLRTIKVNQIEKKKKKVKTSIWFAKDYDYMLVRLEQKKKDGQTYLIDMTYLDINGKQLGKR